MPLISVVVCTLNRAERLVKALTGVLDQEGGFEVVVVDHGSTDQTSADVRGMGLTKTRYLVEPVLGLQLPKSRLASGSRTLRRLPG